jgi:hypothetical protein
LGHIPLLGGSAGDNMRFENTAVLLDGRFHNQAAVFVMVASRHPFEMFKSEHAARSGERMVITEADADSRLVTEINAEPAAVEYCRTLGWTRISWMPIPLPRIRWCCKWGRAVCALHPAGQSRFVAVLFLQCG